MSITLTRPDERTAQIGPDEWALRVNLAAFYRLTALYGWDDGLATHISARIPGPEKHFLLNPFGLLFEEVTASSLVKVDLDGNIVDPGPYGINYAGFVIHSAIHGAREDAHFIAHFHSPDGMGVSAHAEGLLPINQKALTIIPSLAYHDYEGIALNLSERERLVAHLGDANFLLLRNHGTLAIGATIGAAWRRISALETAATAQVRSLSIGREGLLIAPQDAQDEVRQQVANAASRRGGGPSFDDLAWAAALRKIQRENPGYED